MQLTKNELEETQVDLDTFCVALCTDKVIAQFCCISKQVLVENLFECSLFW